MDTFLFICVSTVVYDRALNIVPIRFLSISDSDYRVPGELGQESQA